MIYIDPPYNTGKDFVYPDNFKEGLQNYLEFSKQVDEGNKKISTNTETVGRYHSNWLNMMYPRLKLARNLLTDDGVIFISIDDAEQANLKKLCDDVFGEDRFLGQFIWQKKTQPSFLSREVASVTEYLIAYKRSVAQAPLKGGLVDINRTGEMINIGNPVGNRILPRGSIEIANGKFTGTLKAGLYGNGVLQINLLDDVEVVEGIPEKDISISGRIIQSQATIYSEIEKGAKIFIKSVQTLRPTILKVRDEAGIKPPISLFSKYLNKSIPTNTDASAEMKNLFDGINIMDYPKPSGYIKYIVDTVTYNDNKSIVLDFFSGSGTTAHAVMQLNAEDGGSRKHIQVQLPEPTDEKSEAYKAGYKKISDIARERINRAGARIKADFADKLKERKMPLDVGYRTYKLSDTNFTKWQGSATADLGEVQRRLDLMRDSANDDASEADLLVEVMLKMGLPLTTRTTEQSVSGLTIHQVVHATNDDDTDTSEGAPVFYLNEHAKPTLEQLRAVVTELTPSKLVILEDAFQGDNELKTNLTQTCKSYDVELWTV